MGKMFGRLGKLLYLCSRKSSHGDEIYKQTIKKILTYGIFRLSESDFQGS